MHPGFTRALSASSSSPGFHRPSSLIPSIINFGTQQAGIILSRNPFSITRQPVVALSNMSEKAPLIPIAASGGNVPRVQTKCKGRAIGKLLVTTAAAALIYYGIPYGMVHKFYNDVPKHLHN
jgi:hypothetical protein